MHICMRAKHDGYTLHIVVINVCMRILYLYIYIYIYIYLLISYVDGCNLLLNIVDAWLMNKYSGDVHQAQRES